MLLGGKDLPLMCLSSLFCRRLRSTSCLILFVSCHFLFRSPFCEEIVHCRGDHVRLAVRARVFAYPENACAVWLMFACKYRSVLWPMDTGHPKTTSSCCTSTLDNILDLCKTKLHSVTCEQTSRCRLLKWVVVRLLFCSRVDSSFVQIYTQDCIYISIFVNKLKVFHVTVYFVETLLKTVSSRF